MVFLRLQSFEVLWAVSLPMTLLVAMETLSFCMLELWKCPIFIKNELSNLSLCLGYFPTFFLANFFGVRFLEELGLSEILIDAISFPNLLIDYVTVTFP